MVVINDPGVAHSVVERVDTCLLVRRGSGFDLRNGQAQLWLPSVRGRQDEGQLACSWVTTTEDREEVKMHGREMVTCRLCSQRHKLPHVLLAVSAGALEMVDSKRLRSVLALLFAFTVESQNGSCVTTDTPFL